MAGGVPPGNVPGTQSPFILWFYHDRSHFLNFQDWAGQKMVLRADSIVEKPR